MHCLRRFLMSISSRYKLHFEEELCLRARTCFGNLSVSPSCFGNVQQPVVLLEKPLLKCCQSIRLKASCHCYTCTRRCRHWGWLLQTAVYPTDRQDVCDETSTNEEGRGVNITLPRHEQVITVQQISNLSLVEFAALWTVILLLIPPVGSKADESMYVIIDKSMQTSLCFPSQLDMSNILFPDHI